MGRIAARFSSLLLLGVLAWPAAADDFGSDPFHDWQRVGDSGQTQVRPAASEGSTEQYAFEPSDYAPQQENRAPSAAGATMSDSSAAEAPESPSTSSMGPAAPAKPPKKKPAPPPMPWKGVFYDNDFSYMDDPAHTPLWGESFKDMCVLGDNSLSLGGELRFRYMNDHNRFRPVPGQYPARSLYELWRWRQYLDYDTEYVRAYIELLDASITNSTLPPQAIDKDRWDILNAFVDLKFCLGDQPTTFRYGRQELLYGSQRLISPLDWANTRRTFEGFKVFTHGDEWDIDAFAVRPVFVLPERFDPEDASRTFSGVWLTHRPNPDHTYDYYWLYDRDTDFARDRHTLGGRWLGAAPCKTASGDTESAWLAEMEGGYQFGREGGKDVSAGFFTGGLGYSWNAAPWQPCVWGYFDWASGGDPTAGTNHTFDQLFPLIHYYLGWFDAVARQNIIDYNVQFTVKPCKKVTCVAWMHFFELADPRDAFYLGSGAVFARNPAGSNRTHVGDELDLTINYALNPNMGVLVGSSWFWNGDFLKNSLPPRPFDGECFYVQTTLRY